MKRILQALKTLWMALAISMVFTAAASSQIHAQSVSPPYRYQPNGAILDGASNIFTRDQFGCGFDASNGSFILASSDPGAAPPLQNWCDRNNDNVREPADFYWHDGNNLWISTSGERSATRNEAANMLPVGNTPAFLFNALPGSAPTTFVDITIENAATPGTPGASSALDFEGNCRQQAGELSWIVCPVLNFANELIAGTIRYVLEFLRPEPLLFGTPRGDYLHEAWKQFLTIANVLLIPVFLVAIYFMLVSANQAYSVTRILPRLVIAVLLMQFSFYIAAFIIDVGNVLAAGIAGIFNTINADIDSTTVSQAMGHLSPQLGDTALDRGVGAAVGGGLAISAGILALFTPLLPPLILLIITFLIGIMVTFIALALRQLAIVVFVVLSPLAMLLGVLPSTEKWMREWFDNIMKLVLIYPVVVLFFAASSTLSRLSLASGNTGEVNQIVAAALPIVTLISIPLLIKFTGRAFRTVAGYVSGVSGKAKGGIMGDPRDANSLASRAKARQYERLDTRARQIANVPGLGWTSRITSPLAKSRSRYALAGERIKDLFSPIHSDPLKRLAYGDEPFNSLNGVENYTQKDLDKTKDVRYDVARFRRMITELALIGGNELKDFASRHPDRAMNAMFGIGRQYNRTMAPDAAETLFDSFKGAVSMSQMFAGSFTIDDARNEWVQSRGPDGNLNSGRLFQLGYGDYHQLPGQLHDRNLAIKQEFVGKASGMLNESASEMTFRAGSGALSDDRIVNRYLSLAGRDVDSLSADDQKFRRSMDALLTKAGGIRRGLQSNIDADELARVTAMTEEERRDYTGYVGGGYNKSGTEITAMHEFAERARQIQAAAEQAGGGGF